MLKKTIKSAATLAIAGLALSGCKPADPAVKADPPEDQSTSAYACSGSDSLATIKGIIRKEAQDHAGDNSAGLDDAGVDDLMEFSLITISSVEPEIKKVSCEAQFGIRVPADAQDLLASKNLFGNYLGKGFTGAMAVPEVPPELARGDGSTITITYSRQRSADDQEYIFSLNNVGPMALALLRASSAIQQIALQKAQAEKPAENNNRQPMPSEIQISQPYSVARKSLISAGYKPAAYKPDDEHHNRFELCEDVEGKVCTLYPELYDCSQGEMLCDFSLIAPSGSTLLVVTRGEIDPKVIGIRWASPSEIAERKILKPQ